MKAGRIVATIIFCGYFIYSGFTSTTWHFIDNVDLIFHEAGHTIFFFVGEFLRVVSGSGFQILLPLLISLYFFFTNQKFSGALLLAWAGYNIVNVSVYAGDAVVMQLPLLGGDNVMHDWNYLLNATHLLSHAALIAQILYGLGMTVIFMSAIVSLYFAAQKSTPDEVPSR